MPSTKNISLFTDLINYTKFIWEKEKILFYSFTRNSNTGVQHKVQCASTFSGVGCVLFKVNGSTSLVGYF